MPFSVVPFKTACGWGCPGGGTDRDDTGIMPRAWSAGSDEMGRDNETGFDGASEVVVVVADVGDVVWVWGELVWDEVLLPVAGTVMGVVMTGY